MCIGAPRIGKRISLYDLDEKAKVNLAKKLPQLTEKRILMVTKNILFRYLDKLADNIFTNGKIYTMDQKNPQVQAVAIRGGEILFAGKMIDALVYKGEKTKIIDLRGRAMLPGFIDPHIHMIFTMFNHWLDLSPYTNNSVDEIKEKIVNKINGVKQGQWVLAQLFDPILMSGKFDVSRTGLDKLSNIAPIYILQSNGHVAHVNSAALKAAGLTKQTPDPMHGRMVRDSNGQLTGQMQDSAAVNLKQYFTTPDSNTYLQNFKEFLQHCASKGCTSLHDCGIGVIDPKADLAILLEAMEDDPPIRYSGYLVSTSWDDWMQQGLKPQFKDPYLRINGIKCWADGSIQGGSAYVRQNYIKKGWRKGHANYDLDILIKSVKQAHDNGWQVGVHANGDAAIDMVLDAFQTVMKQNPKPDMRHRIQHCTICHKDQLKRMKQLGVSPSFLIGHIYYYGHAFRDNILGEQRANLVDPVRTAVECGVRPTIHSDYNCQPVDPLRCIYNAVTRKMRYDEAVLNSKQCITPYEAIKTMTIDAAWQCHMDDIVGSIEAGKMADFVILNEDILKIPESQIINVKVVETWMDGRKTYQSSQFKKLESFNSYESYNSFHSQNSFKSQQSI